MAIALHVTLGDHPAGLLRAACGSGLLPGEVIAIPDDYSHGPLADGVARIAWFRACYQGFAAWRFAVTDAFAVWADLGAMLRRAPPGEIVLWAGGNASEATLLALACDRLAGQPAPLSHVALPEASYTSDHDAAALAGLFAGRRMPDGPARAALARDFARIRDETGCLRRWQGGRVIAAPLDRYDGLLLRACAADWVPAARLVGGAMAACDRANRMSDLFLATRLRALIAAGRIEADRAATGLRDYAVRLPRAPA